ncbi:MAG: biotin/lipoyl-binding protein, partial [Methylococcales bacterium]|nr:biotin/lipoyl-binding protein [Methylococcales bacterium]
MPIIILLISLFIAVLFVVLGEKPKKVHRPQPPLSVEIFSTKRSNYSVVLETQGTVKARTESSLIPEISGRITTVSDAFRSGGFFKKGQLLVQIDPRNYKIDIRVAEANFAEQQFRLEEEQARVKLALKNWKKINPTKKASDLTLHIPQLKLAQAALDSAKAQLEKAQINLEKTQ